MNAHITPPSAQQTNHTQLIHDLCFQLVQADRIIQNFIAHSTEQQRIHVAWDNHLDDLDAQWAFASADRKTVIERALNVDLQTVTKITERQGNSEIS